MLRCAVSSFSSLTRGSLRAASLVQTNGSLVNTGSFGVKRMLGTAHKADDHHDDHHGHGGHYDPYHVDPSFFEDDGNRGNLFSRKPLKPGEKREREGWELPVYIGVLLPLFVFYVAQVNPDDSVTDWADREIAARQNAAKRNSTNDDA
eukprot:TRINITY_DN491_c0_g1_i1.p2 TRINITY_DN491_c0_g1~~TRINITY_DN491_c0_g1_i1.p2  ORF type:complete len:148 (-),score=49.21 TRINITY_DN491_c0_g1_i1:128-571(-)